MNGIELIAQERQRQINTEGWTPAHDDKHTSAELTNSARAYAMAAAMQVCGVKPRIDPPISWPWNDKWWKLSLDPVRNLVKAGALIAAEIDRLQRKNEVEK